jgi:hypothetical protein
MSKEKETTPYIGVRVSRGKYASRVKVGDNTIQLGRYNDPKEAAKAYDLYVIKNNLNRKTNFLKKKSDVNN